MQIPSPHLATVPYPAPPVPDHWPLPTGNRPLPLDGRAVPALPCAGGHAPQRPPVAMPPCVRVARSSNHESRITNHESRPSRPSLVRGDTPRNAPLYLCHRACASPAVRITNHESRPFRPSLVRGDTPRNAPLYLCHRACASPVLPFEFRRFEFRVSAVPAPGQNESCRLLRPPRQFVSTVLDFASPCASDPRRCPRERSPAGPRHRACRRSSRCCWTRHRGSHSLSRVVRRRRGKSRWRRAG